MKQCFNGASLRIKRVDVSGDSLLTQGLDNVMALVQNPQNDLDVRAIASVAQGDFASRAPMSPAGDAMKMIAKLTGAETKTTFNGGTYTAGGALSPDGKLDKQAGDKWRQSRAQITAAARRIDTLSTRLVSAVKAAKKSGVEVSTQTMNTALGNLDNPLTQAQRSEVRRMREIDEEEGNTIEAAYLAKNREAFKVKQRAALAALPSNVAEAVS
jgi:hypothetical protein